MAVTTVLAILPSHLSIWHKGREALESRWGAISMATLTELDERLYAWLAEVDDARFEIAFGNYFAAAFPAVMRHLARMSRLDAALLEELAQETLLRFFDRIGRGRRLASEQVREALSFVRPLNFGPIHSHHVTAWAGKVREFREAAVSYRLPLDDVARTEWKSWISDFAAKIPPIQQQGRQLVGLICVEVRGRDTDSQSGPSALKSTPFNGVAEHSDAHEPVHAMMPDELGFVAEIKAKTPRVLEAERKHPGFSSLVTGSIEIVDLLPRLRIPTNGYLFDIATSIYVDECKKLSRLKRGGDNASGYRAVMHDATMDMESDDGLTSFSEPVGAYLESSVFQSGFFDPTGAYEEVELFEKFYAVLRKPLDDAIANLVAAEKSGRAVSERRRVESLSRKFDRVTAVLASIGEGNTQEETATLLGLSRNQVKYVVEEVQEAFQLFQEKVAVPPKMASATRTTRHDE